MSNEAIKVQLGEESLRIRRPRSQLSPPAMCKDKAVASVSDGVRFTLSRRTPIDHEAAFRSHRATICKDSSLSKALSELPSSLDVFPLFRELTSATSVYQDMPSPFLPQHYTGPSLSQCSNGSRCLARSCDSTTSTDVRRDPRQCTKPEDARLYCSLRDALEILPDEPPEEGTRYVLDHSSGRITQLPSLLSEEKHSVGKGTSDTKACEHEPVQSQLYERNNCQMPTTPELPNPVKCPTRRPLNSVASMLSKPLRLLSSGLSKGSWRTSKQELHPQTRHPPRCRLSSASVAGAPNFGGLCHPGESDSPRSQIDGRPKDLFNGGDQLVRRLSVTKKFGPTLAQSIEETLASLSLPNAEPTSGPIPGSCRRLSDTSRSPTSSHLTSRVVHLRTPLRRRRPAHLRIEIPPSTSFLSSALRSNELQSSQSQPARPSPRKQEDPRLTLRGGCFSSPKKHTERRRYRIDPTQRPADDVLVPPLLWYFGGGRRVLKDQPGKPCHHGQSKSGRGSQKQQNPQTNRDRCEPLTFGDLRQWKRRSRPSDRVNPETGRMGPVYRSYWPEFTYQVSRGKMATMRTPQPRAQNQAYCPQGSGMPGPQDSWMPGPQGYGMPVSKGYGKAFNAGGPMYDCGGGGYGGNMGGNMGAGMAQPQYPQPQYAQPQYPQPQHAQPQYEMSGGLGPGSGAPYAGWR